MERISKTGYDDITPTVAGSLIETSGKAKNKLKRGLANSSSIIIGAFLIFVVFIAYTTEINITSFDVLAGFGLTLFIMFFASYSMYINTADSGVKAGRRSAVYTDSKQKYDTLIEHIIKGNNQARMGEFCNWYIENQIRIYRSNILLDTGIKYDEYLEKYAMLTGKELKNSGLPEKVQKLIKKANAVKPLKLTPDMIFKRDRTADYHALPSLSSDSRRKINYVTKFLRSCVTCFLTASISTSFVKKPSWETFVEACIKLMPVILNAVMGYKMGYESITVNAVNYITDQSMLLQRSIEYFEKNPKPIDKYEHVVV